VEKTRQKERMDGAFAVTIERLHLHNAITSLIQPEIHTRRECTMMKV